MEPMWSPSQKKHTRASIAWIVWHISYMPIRTAVIVVERHGLQNHKKICAMDTYMDMWMDKCTDMCMAMRVDMRVDM